MYNSKQSNTIFNSKRFKTAMTYKTWYDVFQIDLRDDAATIEKLAKNKQKPLSLEMGEKLAKELRAVKYVECSALTQVRCLIT